jgi:hypothetical protein
MVLKSSVEPLGSPAGAALTAMAPVSGNSRVLSARGAGPSLDGAARDAQRAVPRSGDERRAAQETPANGDLWESSEVGFAGRTGFVKLALERNVPIVPVVAIGGQETALFLGRGRRLASSLQLNRLLRLKVLPLVIGPPFGVTLLDLPGRIPLPSKITIRVLPPLDLRERLGPKPDPEEGYRLVTRTMQRTLTGLANKRRFPVIG